MSQHGSWFQSWEECKKSQGNEKVRKVESPTSIINFSHSSRS